MAEKMPKVKRRTVAVLLRNGSYVCNADTRGELWDWWGPPDPLDNEMHVTGILTYTVPAKKRVKRKGAKR